MCDDAPVGTLDRAFERFWQTRDAGEILATRAAFAEVVERLARGPAYGAAETGELRWQTLPDADLPTRVVVPATYDPAQRYPVRVFLHGGLARAPDDPARPKPLAFGDRYLAVYPQGSRQVPWWSSAQLANLRAILDRLKRTYNVDENRVQLVGVSDGGSAAFFVGMKDPTPWSSFVSLNGFLRVLATASTKVDGELYARNLAHRPCYVVNGEHDALYPAAAVAPYIAMLERAGADVTFRALAGARHDTSWWPREQPAIDAFEEAHPRDPLPAALAWETERVDRHHRIAWLVIDKLRSAAAPLDDGDPANTVDLEDARDFGLRVDSRRAAGREVVDVIAGTAAARAGLAIGDAIARMDGSDIASADDIADVLEAHTPGSPLVIEVDRRGQRMTLQASYPPVPGPPRRETVFARTRPSGRVAVRRDGNAFVATARCVSEFTLLLSPAVIDFARPVTVTVDGATVFDGMVEPSVATLLEHAARDADRTMLFGAELRISVP